MHELVLENAEEYVRELFSSEYSGHDWYHILRVTRMAERLAIEEHADVLTVRLAALLHDVDDRKLSPETCMGKDRARAFLRTQNATDAEVESIIRILEQVSYMGADSVVPDTLEGKCVQDADRLDAMGAIGIARAFAYGGSHQRLMYDPDVPPAENMGRDAYYARESHTVNHFYEKLLLLKDLMNTQSGKRMAEQRDAYMRSFLDEFFAEWNGQL